MTRSLPRTTAVLADAQVAADLRLAGFTAVRTPDDASGARFVVSTPTLRQEASSRPDVAAALASSVPVAAAGSGASAVTVRQIASVAPTVLASEARTRVSSENELLMNPQITTAAQAADVLRAGALDLRSATVLALLASNGPVTIVRIVVDPAEKAAGRPARVIDIRTTWPKTVATMVGQVSADYRLSSITTQPSGAQRLVWPVDITSGGNV